MESYKVERVSRILEWLDGDSDDLIIQLLVCRRTWTEQEVEDLRKVIVERLERMTAKLRDLDIEAEPTCCYVDSIDRHTYPGSEV